MRTPAEVMQDLGNLARIIGESFWLLSLGVISIFAFFVALGAIDPGDVMPLTIAVLVLVLLFVFRTIAVRRAGAELQLEERKTHERERRGF